MTLMGRVFEMLLSRDFVEFLGRLVPLITCGFFRH